MLMLLLMMMLIFVFRAIRIAVVVSVSGVVIKGTRLSDTGGDGIDYDTTESSIGSEQTFQIFATRSVR